MNRLKLWLYALLVVAAATAAVRAATLRLHAEAIRTVDERLAAARARLAVADRALVDQASAVAALAARDPKLLATLHAKEAEPAPAPAPTPRGKRSKAPPPPPPPDPAAQEAATQAALAAAVAAAESALGAPLPAGSQIAGGNREWLARRSEAGGDAAELVELVAAAIDGKARRSQVRMGGQLWSGAAAPAGPDAGLAVLVPLAAGGSPVAGSGATLALTAPGVKLVSGKGTDVEELVRAAVAHPDHPVDAGQLAPMDLGLGVAGVPRVPLLFVRAPAQRVIAVPMAGVKDGFAVLSAPTDAVLAPLVRLQWFALAGAAAALLVGLLLGFLMSPGEVAAAIPAELLTAAGRIERGEFGVRAPVLAGKLGTVAAALNRAADAAEQAAAHAASKPTLSQEFFVGQPPAAPPEPALDAFQFPVRGAPEPGPEPFTARPVAEAFAGAPEPAPARGPNVTQRLDGAALGAAFEAAPVRAAPAAEPAAPAEPAAAWTPAEDDGEAEHWREVFQDFLRVRAECGEPAEGLTFDRFRQKLVSNKAALVAKYACRTVRFQVYVKEGKAALKATPVR
ncbi:MAG TPA: MXAN_5187 family protein [Anaeromyxobacter sp.]|nr:MXAN_5187 family protein [Anaeromyxobacter sp.]